MKKRLLTSVFIVSTILTSSLFAQTHSAPCEKCEKSKKCDKCDTNTTVKCKCKSNK